MNYKNAFKDSDAFEAQTPKIIEFCGRTIEDFINIKGETPLEGLDDQNFYKNTFLSIKIVCSAINEQGISIDSNGYKEIWDYFFNKLGQKHKYVNLIYNYNDIYLDNFLSDIIKKNLYNKISSDEFGLGSFTSDENLTHLNNKTLSIIIYILRFAFHSYTNITKSFYSELIDYNSSEDITNIINKYFIPGRMNDINNKGIKRLSLKEFCLLDYENKDSVINSEPKIEIITIIVLRFLFYSHLFVRNLLGKISDSTFSSNYSISENYTCLRMLISLWDTLNSEELIPGSEKNKVQIFLNRVNKEINQYYKNIDFSNNDNTKNFEKEFNDYIIKCRNEYEYFKLIFADKTMEAIIKQNNFPLSYGDDYPYMNYFVLISYPNIEQLKEKMKGKEENNQLYLMQQMMNYDENLNEDKFKKIRENKMRYKFDMSMMNIISFSPYSYKEAKLIDLIINNKNIMKKYYNSLIKKDTQDSISELDKEAINLSKSSNEFSQKFFDSLLKKISKKNNYLYKNIRRPIPSQYAINDESIVFDIEKISNYKSYPHLMSKYIYKDIFMEDTSKTEYIDFQIKIDYNNYKNFDIDLEEFEDELESIILPNKRLFYSNDYQIKTIYNFDTFKSKKRQLLNDFIRQYKNGFEKIDTSQKIEDKINIKDLFPKYIDDIIEAFSSITIDELINKKYIELINLNNLVKNELKKNLLDKLEKNGNNINQQIIFNMMFSIYCNLLKIIDFIVDKNISLEISLYDFIINLPDLYNISFFSKYFFENNKEYKIKHLYYIFEEFEKYLFPFILLHVNNKYKIELYDENKENILIYFEFNKERFEEINYSKKVFIDVLRKFISRYLISSDLKNEEIYEDSPVEQYLNRSDLWPLELFYDKKDIIENLLNEFKDLNFLVQHSVCLYQCLTGINFDCNGNINKNKEGDETCESSIIITSESENEYYNFYKDYSYFNKKNSQKTRMIKISELLKEQNLSNSNLFLFYNLQNNFIIPEISNNNKSFIYFTYTNSGLSIKKINLNLDLKKGLIFDINNISTLNNDKLNNLQNITHFGMIKKNEIFCIGTNNSTAMIIKLKDNFSNVELLQEINLTDSCVNNLEIYNQGKTLIIANEKHILLYELKEDNNNFNSYELKKDINTENNTYILKINEQSFAAFISPNTVKIYDIINNDFIEKKVFDNIKCDINSTNQKQYKLMNLVGKNKNIISICSNEHNIYLINTNIKQEINKGETSKINYERYSGDYNSWFSKHSSANKEENKINLNSELSKKIETSELNINSNNNQNKKIEYGDWFKVHCKNKINNKKNILVNCTMNECNNNFVSVISCYDDYIMLLDNSNKVIISKINMIDDEIENLQYIGEFGFNDIICFTPFGLYYQKIN